MLRKMTKLSAHLISRTHLMTNKITKRALVGLLETQVLMALLTNLGIHHVDLDVFMSRKRFLHVMQLFPFARDDILTFR
jgi:hypothetical protein